MTFHLCGGARVQVPPLSPQRNKIKLSMPSPWIVLSSTVPSGKHLHDYLQNYFQWFSHVFAWSSQDFPMFFPRFPLWFSAFPRRKPGSPPVDRSAVGRQRGSSQIGGGRGGARFTHETMVIFHRYVGLREGIYITIYIYIHIHIHMYKTIFVYAQKCKTHD